MTGFVWIENPPLDKALTFKKRLPHKHDSLSSVFINFLIYLIKAGSTHLKICPSSGMINLSEIFLILSGNFIR